MTGTIILYMSEWDNIRDSFTDQDKTVLNAAICGEVICPRAVVLDMAKLSPEVKAKLEGHGHWRNDKKSREDEERLVR